MFRIHSDAEMSVVDTSTCCRHLPCSALDRALPNFHHKQEGEQEREGYTMTEPLRMILLAGTTSFGQILAYHEETLRLPSS